jgi:hypothetical protein
MTSLAKLERDQSFNPQIFNMNFEENEKKQEEIDIMEREKERIKKEQLYKEQDIPFAKIIPENLYNFGIDVSRLLSNIIKMIVNKQNPLPYIMSNNNNQFIFVIMLLIFGLSLFILSNIL